MARRQSAKWTGSFAFLALWCVCGLGGCSFGPKALLNTHGRYNESIKQVQDEELLRNIVRLRYNDSLSMLEVSSIASQYELGAGAEARPFFTSPNPSNHPYRTFTSVLPDVTASVTNRPTITLIPGDDAETIRRLLTPASAEAIIFFVQTGWPVGTVSRLWFDSLNGVPNASSILGGGPARTRAPDFERFCRIASLLQSIEMTNAGRVVSELDHKAMGQPLLATQISPEVQVEAARSDMEFRPAEESRKSVLSRSRRKLLLEINPQAQGNPDLMEFCELLGLDPGLQRYEITAGELSTYPQALPAQPLKQIDLVPRSPIQVLFYLSHGVCVPAEHCAAGIVRNVPGPDGQPFDWTRVTNGLFSVCSVRQIHRPESAYVAVKYRGYWFYIDDRDHASKMAFNLMVPLTKLDLSKPTRSQQQSTPLLTLPVGR